VYIIKTSAYKTITSGYSNGNATRFVNDSIITVFVLWLFL